MAWHISGRSMELCSCKMFCPCWLGPDGEPDEEWCSSTFVFEIQEGSSDGVDLAATRVAFTAHWPANFFAGNGTARLYIGEAASSDQRGALEDIFGGRKGGPFEPLWGAVISNWLPAETTTIDADWGESPSVTVGSVGQARLTRLKDDAGRATSVAGAAAQAAFQFDGMDLASAKGSHWSDPGLRSWDGDSGTLHAFDWSG